MENENEVVETIGKNVWKTGASIATGAVLTAAFIAVGKKCILPRIEANKAKRSEKKAASQVVVIESSEDL